MNDSTTPSPDQQDSDSVRLERLGLRLSVAGALFMAALGFGFAAATRSEAVFLDGAFSLVGFAVGLIALRVATLVMRPDDERFHFGYAAYEPMLNLTKGLLIAFICLIAGASAVDAIVKGGRDINGGVALIYALIAALGCMLIAAVQRRLGRRASSPLLQVDAANWWIDGLMSSAVAVVFLFAYLVRGTRFEHLLPYADPGVVLLLVVLSIPIPVQIIRGNWRQLLGRAPGETVEAEASRRIDAALAGESGISFRLRLLETGRWLYLQVYVILEPGRGATSVAELDRLRHRILAAVSDVSELGIDVIFTTDEVWFSRSVGLVHAG
jgi:cation diffusion facilitator family transporter